MIGFNFCTHGLLKAGVFALHLNSSSAVLPVVNVFEASVPVTFRIGDHWWKRYNRSNTSAWGSWRNYCTAFFGLCRNQTIWEEWPLRDLGIYVAACIKVKSWFLLVLGPV